MGKRYGNAVTPDDIIEQGYGADSLRLYEMFIGPYDQGVDWNPNGIDGTKRFLNRVWALVQDQLEATSGSVSQDKDATASVAKTVHKTIKKVTLDLEDFGFNTAIAAMMECVNELYKLKTTVALGSKEWQENLKLVVQILAPFAPHITEELWQQLGGVGSVHVSEWPAFNSKLVTDDTVTIVVQVNGKLRAQLKVDVDAHEQEVVEQAQQDDNVTKYLENKQVIKTVYVPSKLVNFVVR